MKIIKHILFIFITIKNKFLLQKETIKKRPPVSLAGLTSSVYPSVIEINHKFYTNYFDINLCSEIMGKYTQTIEHSLISVGTQSIDRKTVNEFKQDPLIPQQYETATNDFYNEYNSLHKEDGNRVDKGHVNPYSAFDFDEISAKESMFIENTCPQFSFFNEHQWEEVEQYVIKKVSLIYDKENKEYKPNQDNITVYTGVLIKDNKITDGTRYIYLPDYYWKVISYNKDGKIVYESWLGKNSADNKDTNPEDIRIDINKLKFMIDSYYPGIKLEF